MMFSAGFNTIDNPPDHDEPTAVFTSFKDAADFLLHHLGECSDIEQKLIWEGHSDKDPVVVEKDYAAVRKALTDAPDTSINFGVASIGFHWWIIPMDITDAEQESIEAMNRSLLNRLSKGSHSGHAAEPEPF